MSSELAPVLPSYSPIIDKVFRKKEVCDSIQICAFPQLTHLFNLKDFYSVYFVFIWIDLERGIAIQYITRLVIVEAEKNQEGVEW